MFSKASTAILASIAVKFASDLIGSKYVFDFLDANLVLLLVALAAINTTTLGVVMTKLREISLAYYSDFSKVINEMRTSIKEQVTLILLSVAVQIVSASKTPLSSQEAYIYISQVLLISIFLYALKILYDTANMIFVILEFENEEMKKKDRDDQK